MSLWMHIIGGKLLMDPDITWWNRVVENILSSSSITSSTKSAISLVRPLVALEDSVIISTPNEFFSDFLNTHSRPIIEKALAEVFGRPMSYRVLIDPTIADPTYFPVANSSQSLSLDIPVASQSTKEEKEKYPTKDSSFSASTTTNSSTLEKEHLVNGDTKSFIFQAMQSSPASTTTSTDISSSASSQPSFPSVNNTNPRAFSSDESRINPNLTFDRFVIGQSNRFSHAAALAVAESPGMSYNPLFIYGSSGLGKTHLLHAIGNYVKETKKELRVKYVNSEEFTNDFINSIQINRSESFQQRYRNVDVLLIDDIQFLSGKEQTLEEFFHTFNSLHNGGKQIVITSDVHPKDLAGFADRLRSRFESGLTTDVIPPDLETRTAIIRKKSDAECIQIPDDVLSYIASHITSNIREIEGALLRVTAYASLNSQQPSLPIAEMVIKDLITEADNSEVTPALIMNQTAEYFEIKIDHLCSTDRSQEVSYARQIAMYLCRELTEISLPRIGVIFGNRDHSTVLYACRKVGEKLSQNPTMFNQVQEITSLIKHGNQA